MPASMRGECRVCKQTVATRETGAARDHLRFVGEPPRREIMKCSGSGLRTRPPIWMIHKRKP